MLDDAERPPGAAMTSAETDTIAMLRSHLSGLKTNVNA